MPGDPRWCAARLDGQVVHGLTWDELDADPALFVVNCAEHDPPRSWPGGVLDISATAAEQADYEP